VISKIISEIRRKKEKVGLTEMIMASMKKKNEKDEKIRDLLRKRLLGVYEDDTCRFYKDEDFYYNRVMSQCNRILKYLRAHSTSIDCLEKKLNKMTKGNLPENPFLKKPAPVVLPERKIIQDDFIDIHSKVKALGMARFDRVKDELQSSSDSGDDKNVKSQLNVLQKIAFQPKGQQTLQNNYTLPVMTNKEEEKFLLTDSSEGELDNQDEAQKDIIQEVVGTMEEEAQHRTMDS